MSDTGKLIVAFFLGLAVALGSAFLFMRSTQPKPAMVAATAPAPVSAPIVPSIPSPEPAASIPAAKPEAKAPVASLPSPEPRVTKAARLPKTAAKKNTDTLGASAAPPVNIQQPPAAEQPPTATTPAASVPQPVFTPAPAAPPVQQPHHVTIPSGTVMNVRLNEALASDRNSSGDTFRATLTAPLIVDGFVIADRGSRVQGEVVSSDRSGRVKGRASMTLALSEINTTDGQHIRVQTDSFNREASGGKGSDIAKVAGGSALGALIGGLAGGGKGAAIGAGAGGAAGTGVVLGTRGKEVNLPTETALTFRLTNAVTITEQFRN